MLSSTKPGERAVFSRRPAVGADPGDSASLGASTIHSRIHGARGNGEGAASLTIHATADHGDIDARSPRRHPLIGLELSGDPFARARQHRRDRTRGAALIRYSSTARRAARRLERTY